MDKRKSTNTDLQNTTLTRLNHMNPQGLDASEKKKPGENIFSKY